MIIFPTLYISLYDSFCNWNFVHWITLSYFTHPSTNLLSGNYQFVHRIYSSDLCVCVCVCVLTFVHFSCFLDSTYKWNHMVFFFMWLTSFSIMYSRSKIPLPFMAFHCTYLPYLLHVSKDGYLGGFNYLDHCKQCCYKYRNAYIFSN